MPAADDQPPLPLKTPVLAILRDGQMALLTHIVAGPAPFELLGHLTATGEPGLWRRNGRWTERLKHTHRLDISHFLDADGKPRSLGYFELIYPKGTP